MSRITIDLSEDLDVSKKKRRRRGPSPGEELLDKQLKEAGIDGYERDTMFIPGRRFRADFWFKELKLAVEVDGGLWMPRAGHSSGVGAHRDRERDALAYTDHGILTLRVATDHVNDERAIEWVKKAIERRKAETDGST